MSKASDRLTTRAASEEITADRHEAEPDKTPYTRERILECRYAARVLREEAATIDREEARTCGRAAMEARDFPGKRWQPCMLPKGHPGSCTSVPGLRT